MDGYATKTGQDSHGIHGLRPPLGMGHKEACPVSGRIVQPPLCSRGRLSHHSGGTLPGTSPRQPSAQSLRAEHGHLQENCRCCPQTREDHSLQRSLGCGCMAASAILPLHRYRNNLIGLGDWLKSDSFMSS